MRFWLAAAVSVFGAAAQAQDAWQAGLARRGAGLVLQGRAAGAAIAARQRHQPSALSDLLERVEATASAGRVPVVMFDLDDTLLDPAYRNIAILKEFAAQDGVRRRFPDAAARMAAVAYADIRYDMKDTLGALGVAEAAQVLPELTPFWAARFFDNAYLPLDHANAGGVEYVREVVRRGGVAVYLTGRWEAMRPGTERTLADRGFPAADGKSVLLMMKPEKTETDVSFKVRAFESIAALGEVVGGFENEPANVNAYAARFPAGLMIFLDTRHSTGAPAPLGSIPWVRDFRAP